MKEYIDREAALALTHEINIPKIGYRHRCIDPGAIKELPAADVAPATGWIPVTERLPEHTATYLVSVGVNYGGEGEHPEVMTALFQAGGKGFYVDYDRSISGPIVGKPTHWLPLPEPPKEVSE